MFGYLPVLSTEEIEENVLEKIKDDLKEVGL